MKQYKITENKYWQSLLKISNDLKKQKKLTIFINISDDLTTEMVLKELFELAEYHYSELKILNNENNQLVISLIKITENLQEDWHLSNLDITEKYGHKSEFFKISKLRNSFFLLDFQRSLQDLCNNTSILILGINKGEEIDLLEQIYPDFSFSITGVDFSASVVSFLKEKYLEEKKYSFFQLDINKLQNTHLANRKFDLIISIGTLQSATIETKKVFMELVQNNLVEKGKIIIGNPNCRYLNNQPFYGNKIKNFHDRDFSLVIKDLYFYKKYLQQHKFVVRIFGKNYIFLTGER